MTYPQTEPSILDINWSNPTLSWLKAEQKLKFQENATVCRYTLGEKIWSKEDA
jgi:hypothetical protein